jgi:hypothetical protein
VKLYLSEQAFDDLYDELMSTEDEALVKALRGAPGLELLQLAPQGPAHIEVLLKTCASQKSLLMVMGSDASLCIDDVVWFMIITIY